MNPSRPVNEATPWFETPSNASRCAAFTFVELLVIISLLALLIIVQWPALAKATHQTARAQCAANLRQLTTALQIYATENGDKLPVATAGYWAWDIPWNLATTLINYGASRNAMYCPANAGQNVNGLWNYAPNSFRVISYALTLVEGGSIASTNWNATLTPQPIAFGPSYFPPPLASRRVLVADATLSQPGQNNEALRDTYNYTSIQSGYAALLRTSHVERFLPSGGNLGMLDGHIEWTAFSQMHPRTGSGGTPVFWW